jgi:DNA mismatch repair protein MutS
MVEMIETASILRHATHKSLVVLDEIGRGTSTYDGLAIAWAVAEHMHDVVQCRALFATHYHELTELAKTAGHLVNVSVSAREHDGGIVFLHRLVAGPASRSYGIAVAKLAGLPEGVLARAKSLLETFEGEGQKRGRGDRESKRPPQLGLFEPPPSDRRPASVERAQKPESGALALLAAADLDRMTPLDALTLLAKMKRDLR